MVKAADRDVVLGEISARMARYEKFDPDTYRELKELRGNVKDIFNKGLSPSDELMEQMYFLDPKTKEILEKMTSSYDRVVTPEDFKEIAKIMSGHLFEQVPILKAFTGFFGRLSEEYLVNAKPSTAAFDWKSIVKTTIRGNKKKGYTLPDSVSRLLGIKPGESISEKLLKRFGFWEPNGTLDQIINGIDSPEYRRTGAKFFKMSVKLPDINFKKGTFGTEKKLTEIELFTANKMPRSWVNVPF